MELVFIVNEEAGKGAMTWQTLKRALTMPYRLYMTQYPQHATDLVTQLAQTYSALCIIAVGGDGTIHEVLQGAISYPHVVVGVCSAGSGNDFARAFPTFQHAAQIERWYEYQRVKMQDIGTFNDRIFMNNAGVGFDAYVVQLANQSKLKKRLNRLALGKLSYVYYLVKGLLTYEPFTIYVNDRRYENVWFVTISNQPYFGGGMKISPHSKTDDGMLECTIVHRLSRVKLLSVFATVFFGGHTRFQEVTQLQCDAFTLQLQQEMCCHVDGEAFTQAALCVNVAVKPQSWRNAHN